jgi:hypothetical protein
LSFFDFKYASVMRLTLLGADVITWGVSRRDVNTLGVATRHQSMSIHVMLVGLKRLDLEDKELLRSKTNEKQRSCLVCLNFASLGLSVCVLYAINMITQIYMIPSAQKKLHSIKWLLVAFPFTESKK